MTDEIRLGLLNLHDAFLNASLMRDHMIKEPIAQDPRHFLTADRARLERLWVALLAVLVESWLSGQMRPVVEYIKTVTDVTEVETLLRDADKDGRHKKMVACRHYMFHRDRRKYWDEGRFSPIGELDFYSALHAAFSVVLHRALAT